NAMALDLTLNKRENVTHEIVDIERRRCGAVLAEHRADAGDDLAGAMAVIDDPLQGSCRPVEVGLRSGKRAQADAAAGDDRGQRLTDLVGDRGRHRGQCRPPGHLRELAPGPPQLVLGMLELGNVARGAIDAAAMRYRLPRQPAV